jgi:3-phosphoshikimate 1-carboxyvinyltransferase
MEMIHLSGPGPAIKADIRLDGSKSISNRALIISALSGVDPSDWISDVSTSKDTVTLQKLLIQEEGVFDAGDAGTTFRFMTAYLAIQRGTQVLTGSHRMLERPVGGLVTALQSIGADIRYLGKPGYPPLEIGDFHPSGGPAEIRIAANVSSQFLSALAMIGPYLPQGLRLIPEGPLVSKPYLEMTIRLMERFGARVGRNGENLFVEPRQYKIRAFAVEADWSAASYWYAIAAFAKEPNIVLRGLFDNSWQGDAVLPYMMEHFGIRTWFDYDCIRLTRSGPPLQTPFEWNFIECPDIAQTLAVVCGGLGVEGRFSGLNTLSIKETDRIAALTQELQKVGVRFEKQTPDGSVCTVSGKAAWQEPPVFATYNDHRMAMAFAPLAMQGPIVVEHPDVVRKSYPGFWRDLEQAGFRME